MWTKRCFLYWIIVPAVVVWPKLKVVSIVSACGPVVSCIPLLAGVILPGSRYVLYSSFAAVTIASEFAFTGTR